MTSSKLRVTADHAGDAPAWDAISDQDQKIDDAIARAIAVWWQQAPNGHAGTFTALANGQAVARDALLAAIDSEYDEALPDMQAAFDNLRAWAS